jgi:hypothetical protein
VGIEGEAIIGSTDAPARGLIRLPRYDGGSSWGSPVSRPSSLTRSTGLATAVVALILLGWPTAARAAEPGESDNVLDHARVDVAVVTGPDDVPRLLVVDPTRADDAAVSLSMLSRGPDGIWTQDARSRIVTFPPTHGLRGRPWLIGLGDRRFALITSLEVPELSVIAFLEVRTPAGGRPTIEESDRLELDAFIDDAGVADVDGDAQVELVLANARTLRQGGTCQGSRLWVVDPVTLAVRTIEVEERRLAAGVVGRFDDVPGDDLAVYAHPNCPAGPDTGPELRLMALRLADGTVIADHPAATDDAPAWVPPPVRFDADDDGRDELLALVPRGLAVVDPHDSWADIRLATSAAMPLGAVPSTERSGDPVMRVAWLEPSIDGRGLIGTEQVRRTADGDLDTGPATVLWSPSEVSSRWTAVVASATDAASSQAAPPGWLGVTDDPACPVLLVPLAIVSCRTEGVAPGPAWVATRPIEVINVGGERRLITAVGLQRERSSGLPGPPTPWAGGQDGRWRHGPSDPFALAETRVADLTNDGAPGVTLDRDAAVGPAVTMGAASGTRLLVTAAALATDAAEPPADPDLRTALTGVREAPSPQSATLTATLRLQVRPGTPSGSAEETASLDLAGLTLLYGDRTERWAVTIVTLDDRGEVGDPLGASVVLDVQPPPVSLVVPDITPIWPFAARIDGTVEPGAVVRGADGRLPVAADGTFVLETALAPWPQTVRVVATDAFGNETVEERSVVGGVDYRGFPWAAILALGVLAAVIVSGVAGSHRRRWRAADAGGRDGRWDDGPLPEFEELPPGGGLGAGR